MPMQGNFSQGGLNIEIPLHWSSSLSVTTQSPDHVTSSQPARNSGAGTRTRLWQRAEEEREFTQTVSTVLSYAGSDTANLYNQII